MWCRKKLKRLMAAKFSLFSLLSVVAGTMPLFAQYALNSAAAASVAACVATAHAEAQRNSSADFVFLMINLHVTLHGNSGHRP
jgi:hypothetical protein